MLKVKSAWRTSWGNIQPKWFCSIKKDLGTCGICKNGMRCSVASVRSDSANPWTVASQASLSLGFSRQECWSGLPCPPLEKWYRRSYLQNRKRDPDIENKRRIPRGKSGVNWDWRIYTTVYRVDNRWECSVCTGNLLRAPCDLHGKEIQKGGHVCSRSTLRKKLTQRCKATIVQLKKNEDWLIFFRSWVLLSLLRWFVHHSLESPLPLWLTSYWTSQFPLILSFQGITLKYICFCIVDLVLVFCLNLVTLQITMMCRH